MPMFGKRRQTTYGLTKHPNAKEVRISILFTRLGEIDTINEKFSCDATLFITWRENADVLKKCDTDDDNSYYWDSKNLWDPQLYIDNAIGDVKEKDVKFRLEKFYDDLKDEWYFEVHMIKRIQGTFFEKLELYHFPFDVQDLSITLTSHRTMDEIILVQDYSILAKMTKSASLDKHIWKLYDHVNIKMHTIRNDLPIASDYPAEEIETACTHSAITMQCRVSRKPGYFIINCLLPTLMITLCVFFTFLMNYERFQYRFSLLFTTMLTSITFRWAIHGRVLPTISYLTFLDVYCVSSIMIVFSAMVWHACYLILHNQDEELADRCDIYAMIGFAIAVFLVHVMQTIWFFIAFKKRHELEELDKRVTLTYLRNRMTVNTGQLNSLSNFRTINNKRASALPNSNNINSNTTNTSNENAKANSILNTNTINNLKSKRMLYSFSKLDDKAVIKIHHNTDKSNYVNKNKKLGEELNENLNFQESEESPKLSTLDSSDTSTSTNSNFNRRNSLLNAKKNSICIADEQQGNYVRINIIKNDSTVCNGNVNNSQNLQSKVLKNNNQYFSLNKSDELSVSNDLNYQYIPLVHQSSRDS